MLDQCWKICISESYGSLAIARGATHAIIFSPPTSFPRWAGRMLQSEFMSAWPVTGTVALRSYLRPIDLYSWSMVTGCRVPHLTDYYGQYWVHNFAFISYSEVAYYACFIVHLRSATKNLWSEYNQGPPRTSGCIPPGMPSVRSTHSGLGGSHHYYRSISGSRCANFTEQVPRAFNHGP